MRKKLLPALLVIIGIFMASGCMRLDRELEFKSNGNVELSIGVSMAQELIELMYGSKEAFYEDMNNSYGEYDDNIENVDFVENDSQWHGVKANAKFSNIKDVEDALTSDDSVFTIEKNGFIKKTITVKIVNESVTEEDYSSYGLQDIFAIRVPSKIVSTNGLIDANDNRRATWDLSKVEFGDQTEKEMTVSYINSAPIIIGVVVLLAVVAIVVCIIVIIVIIRIAKNKKSKNIGQ